MIRVPCWRIDLVVLFPQILQLKEHTEERTTEENPHGKGLVHAQVEGLSPLPTQQQNCHSGFLLTAICDEFYRQPAVIQASFSYRFTYFHIVLLPYKYCCIIFYPLTSQACLTLIWFVILSLFA